MQKLDFKTFANPKGESASFYFRPNTADENTILATYHEDEYHFVDMGPAPGQWMIDAGGYVGSTAILYAQLYPDARVLCFEPLPENAEIIRQNIGINHLEDRIVLCERALWSSSGETVRVHYRDDTEVGKTHKFVGSAFPKYHETVSPDGADVKTISLAAAIRSMEIRSVRLLKMDVEGAEYEILKGLTVKELTMIQTMVGEYHNIEPGFVTQPRSKLYDIVADMFSNQSKEEERTTWGAFLFEKKV